MRYSLTEVGSSLEKGQDLILRVIPGACQGKETALRLLQKTPGCAAVIAPGGTSQAPRGRRCRSVLPGVFAGKGHPESMPFISVVILVNCLFFSPS